MTETSDEGLMWPEEVVAVLGLSHVGVLRNYVNRTRARQATGTATDTDVPLPVDKVQRTVAASGNQGPTRVVTSPRYRRADVERCRVAREARKAEQPAAS